MSGRLMFLRWGLIWAWLGASLPAAAQVGSATMAGAVSDPSGNALPGATITVTEDSTNRSRVVVSSSDGGYRVSGLAPGAYSVRVELGGFRPAVRTGVRLITGESIRVDVEMELATVAETLTIVADGAQLRSTSASLGHVVDHHALTALPLNGRTFITLAGLAPGVALPPNSLLPRINGGRPRTNEYLFDGISVLQPEPGQVAFFPNVEAIQEFKIESNSPPAEFGRFNGGVVNLTTRAGTNTLRGTGFEFFRHERLNARNLFGSTTTARPRYRRNQYGAVLGGPIQKNRTFFFVDYQGQRQAIERTVISTVPTALQRQGVFTERIAGRVPSIYDPDTTLGRTRTQFADNTIPANRIDPVAFALLARYPLPNAEGTANNYRRAGEGTQDQEQFSVRVDRQFASNRDHVFGRLTRFSDNSVPVTPLPDGSGATSGTPGPQSTTAYSFASHYQRSLSFAAFNELRLGDTRRYVHRTPARMNGSAAVELGLPGIPATGAFSTTLPTVLIAGYQQLGSPASTASDFNTSVTEIADTFTWLRGRHTFKFGGDFRWVRLNVLQPPSPTGSFTFSSLFTDLPGIANTGTPFASFLLGQVQQFSLDLQTAPIRNRAHIQEYFVQDDWRVSGSLTINAGVRYTLNFPSTEVDNQAAVFNLETQELEFLGRDGHPRGARELHKHNFGPRLGVVQRLSEQAAVRGAYGLVWIEMTGITTPFTTPVFPFLQTVSQRTLDNIAPAFVLSQGPSVAALPLSPRAGLGQGVFAVDRDLGSGYVHQWNVALQRDLSAHLTFEAAYLGSKITRLGIPDTNLNQLSVGQLALGSALLTRLPNPYFGVIPRSSSLGDPTIPLAQLLKPYPQYTTVSLYRNNVGNSSYQGVSLKVQQRLSRGFSSLITYTRSRLMDDASSVFDAAVLTGPIANYPVADSFNRRLERDYSTGDIPHVFNAAATWELPSFNHRGGRGGTSFDAILSGWTVTGVLTLQSGAPIAVTQVTNNNAFAGFGVQRPNLVGDPALPAEQHTVERWFNTDAFSTAPQFAVGSATRNPVRGPGYRNLDLGLIRRIPLPAARALEFRVEMFNVTNTPALGPPNGTLGSAGFGTITTAGDPRVFQLAARLMF